MNATFFNMDGIDTDNIGLVVSKGELISPFRGDWPSINIDPDNNATIVHGEDNTFNVTDPKSDKVKLYNAVTGSDQIVTDGKPIKPDDRSFFTTNHPRSAIGITKKHKLLLVTVDGRQEGFSEGIPLDELGKLMIKLSAGPGPEPRPAATRATLAIADPEPRVLNCPSSRAHDVNTPILRQVGFQPRRLRQTQPRLPSNPKSHEQPPQPKKTIKKARSTKSLAALVPRPELPLQQRQRGSTTASSARTARVSPSSPSRTRITNEPGNQYYTPPQ
ncbi:MAG: phosphodiester glycosidase family protein [Phycisphaerales bacterium]